MSGHFVQYVQKAVSSIDPAPWRRFTRPDMTALRALLVLIGIVLVERAYVRAGG